MEDLYLAEERYARIRSGEVQTIHLSDIKEFHSDED